MIFFFFSSRRRHTRSLRDWSSDVCSSDLEQALTLVARTQLGRLPVRGSTWQSIARGKATEIEYLNGEICRLGRALGLPTPVNDAVTLAVRQVAATHRYVSLEALLRTCGAAPPAAPPTGAPYAT